MKPAKNDPQTPRPIRFAPLSAEQAATLRVELLALYSPPRGAFAPTVLTPPCELTPRGIA